MNQSLVITLLQQLKDNVHSTLLGQLVGISFHDFLIAEHELGLMTCIYYFIFINDFFVIICSTSLKLH